MLKVFFLLLILTDISFAQSVLKSPPLPSEGSQAVPVLVKPKSSKIRQTLEESSPVKSEKQKSRNDTVMVGYQLITSWLPSKGTLSYTHAFNPNWSLEGEYSWASMGYPILGVDLGSLKEKRFTLQMRRYFGNSFNLTFGPVMNHFKARLGSDVLDNFGNKIRSEFTVENLGLTLGMSNRWKWDNGFTLGFDWIRINIPLVETKIEDKVIDDIADSEDQSDSKKVIRTFNRFPTFVLLGFNLGYSF